MIKYKKQYEPDEVSIDRIYYIFNNENLKNIEILVECFINNKYYGSKYSFNEYLNIAHQKVPRWFLNLYYEN